jgi:hypothetical protein
MKVDLETIILTAADPSRGIALDQMAAHRRKFEKE